MILSVLGELNHSWVWWAEDQPAVTDLTSGSGISNTCSCSRICSSLLFTPQTQNQEWSGGTSDSHHILSYACKQSCYSNSVIKCSAFQWDENRKPWPSTLKSSSLIHVSSSLTSPPSAAWARQVRVLVFIHHCRGRVEGFWSGWGMLNESRGGAGGILAALDIKSLALAPPLSHQLAIPAFLTQLPTVMDDDMCHIKSTCIHRGSASSMPACFWLNRRSELRGRYVALEALYPPHQEGWGRLEAAKL